MAQTIESFMYTIEFSEASFLDLRSFPRHVQRIIVEAITARLRHEPARESRNQKRMRPNSLAGWELRLREYRVLYDVNEVVRIVMIQRIAEKRGNTFLFRGEQEDV